MTPTDTTEKGLETLIVRYLTGYRDMPGNAAGEEQAPYDPEYVPGDPNHYDRDYAVDFPMLLAFLTKTQLESVESLGIAEPGHARSQFLGRLQGEITRYGTIHVLTKGIKHGPHQVDLFYGTPTPGNTQAAILFHDNIFSVTRQLHYSKANANSLDVVIFINGLPLVTIELKNLITGQNVNHAIDQYCTDRDPKELLFSDGRCAVHFAVDDQLIRFCTTLRGKSSVFLPFDKGHNQGAGNPPNPEGIRTDYLWKEILTRASLTNIIENFAGMFEPSDAIGSKKKPKESLWPRYHQLDVVRRLLADVGENGVGKRYLIQHSAGSGKSNSIAWLAHQLISVRHNGQSALDSVIVVTDRTILDGQLKNNIRRFSLVTGIFGHAEDSAQLRDHLASGRKIIGTTVQKFPFVLKGLAEEHAGKRFAIIIDEAHSSQGGRAASKMNEVLKGDATDAEEDYEDLVNKAIEGRKMLTNASYFAFTATPKNKTLELFGTPNPSGTGVKPFLPFHVYSMKQAIQEGFILDVLANYTPWRSYYRLVKSVEDDPEFDVVRARKRMKSWVEQHPAAIEKKAEIIVNHFNDNVYKTGKIKGQARAIVCCKSIKAAITYYKAIRKVIHDRGLAFDAIVAFSGDYDDQGIVVNEAQMNGFPSSKIPDKVKTDPYRILVVGDKFLTGYDEPLLHTMYVDKPLAGVKAVQTLSRLNRTAPNLAKLDTFVLDFFDQQEAIQLGFQDFYQTTILSQETDPNKLHDLQADLDGYQVYSEYEVDTLVSRYLEGQTVDQLHPFLDHCVDRYKELDEDGQVQFKGKAKAFVRTYNFLGAILSFPYPDWEKRSIFLNMLTPKLPAPVDDDPTRGILETIDMESYRVEAGQTMQLSLAPEDASVDPAVVGIGGKPEPEMDFLSSIVHTFNDQFGNIAWTDNDKIAHLIAVELPAEVAQDQAYQDAMANNDAENARLAHDTALKNAVIKVMNTHTDLFKQFQDNAAFRKYVEDSSFRATYQKPAPPPT